MEIFKVNCKLSFEQINCIYFEENKKVLKDNTW
jgi:hypothetical protein